ncbi:MAG: cell division protein ZapA [Phocaeicola sp.]|nr:cell division protein ZapA [Phocaeicola sp.]
MDDKLKIHLLIDNERYPLTIKRDEEFFYREAARQIDNKLNKYRRLYPSFSTVKHWTMVALELAYENAKFTDRNDTQPYLDKLKQLEEEIDNCIRNNEEEE